MKTDSWAGSIEPPRRSEPDSRGGEASTTRVRSIRVECPACGAEMSLDDVIAEDRCTGSLSDGTPCDAELSIQLVARASAG